MSNIIHSASLNQAQKLWAWLGLPFETRRHPNGGPINVGKWRTKHNHVSFRTEKQLAAKRALKPCDGVPR